MIRLRAESPSTSHPLPLLPPIALPHTRESMAMMRAAAPSTYCLAPPSWTPPILPIPLPTSSPPLLLPSTDCRVNVPEVTLPPRKRLCIAPDPRYEIRETSSALTARSTGGFRADYGFVGTLDAKIGRDPDREIGYQITDIWVDPDEIIEEIPVADIVDLLRRDRRSYARTTRLMKSEARASREAWVQSMDASDTTRSEAQLIEALTLLKILQTQMVALQSQQRPARDPAHPDKKPLRKAPRTRTTITLVTNEQLKTLIAQGVADVLAEREATRSKNGKDSHDSGTGVRRQAPLARECTYPDFMKCKPLYFKGIKGVVELTQWFERMETVFRISNYNVENQIKFATCTLLGSDLTW
ncbi:hypothetical protein Tco_0897136 [Tanacetum coccineum]